MPHFVIDCSENILQEKTPVLIMKTVFEAAASTELFNQKDIKVRITPFEHYQLGGDKNAFIHVFANIMEGRNTAQKSILSKKIVSALNELFPDTPIISINIRDFEKATYSNKSMI